MQVSTVTGCEARRQELGRCLRAYRDLVGPRQVGLSGGGRRRAPGLRREEVATLAGVGLTWYTWLEQGRVTASDQVLDAVSRVLGIDDVGREHLRVLSRPVHDQSVAPGPDGLRPLLASWTADPAVLLDARLDVITGNGAWIGSGAASAGDNVLARLLIDHVGPGDDLGPLVAALARRLRMATNLDPVDERLAAVRAQVRAAAPELGPLWDCRGVGAFGRPRVRWAGEDRVAYLLGEGDTAEAGGGAVLVLVRVR
jgi:transcriptional regulator with XRE-family HTH domain